MGSQTITKTTHVTGEKSRLEVSHGFRVGWLPLCFPTMDGITSYFLSRRRGRRMDSEETLILGEDNTVTRPDVDDNPGHAVAVAAPPANPVPVPAESEPSPGPADGGAASAMEVSDVPAPAAAPAPSRRRVQTMRQMAARGANRIGDWSRTRIFAPHLPKGTIDFWIDESIDHGETVKKDMTNVIRKFKREHLSPAEFFSCLIQA